MGRLRRVLEAALPAITLRVRPTDPDHERLLNCPVTLYGGGVWDDHQRAACRFRVATPRRSCICCFRATRSSGLLRRRVPSGSENTYPDITSTLIPGRSAEIRLFNSSPSSLGILRSVSTTSIATGYSREISRASSPSPANRTSWPSASSTLWSRSRISGSSSTIRITCGFGLYTCCEALMAKLLKPSCLHATPLVRDRGTRQMSRSRTSSAQASDVANESVGQKGFQEKMAARNVPGRFQDKA